VLVQVRRRLDNARLCRPALFFQTFACLFMSFMFYQTISRAAGVFNSPGLHEASSSPSSPLPSYSIQQINNPPVLSSSSLPPLTQKSISSSSLSSFPPLPPFTSSLFANDSSGFAFPWPSRNSSYFLSLLLRTQFPASCSNRRFLVFEMPKQVSFFAFFFYILSLLTLQKQPPLRIQLTRGI